MTTAEDVIAQAEEWVGYVETPVNRTPFGAWYGLDGQPYCAMALSRWSFDAGLPIPASTAKGYAYTPSGANWFKQQGRWGDEPRKGAHIFFRFSGPRIHHVGLVTSEDGVFPIDTIEANTSRGSAGSQRDGGGVWRRRRASGIVGYGYPNYEEEDEMNADQQALLERTFNEAVAAKEAAAGVNARMDRLEAAAYDASGFTVVERARQTLRLARGGASVAVRDIYERHGVPIATTVESEGARIARNVEEVLNGRSLADIEQSVAWIAEQRAEAKQEPAVERAS